MVRHKYVVVQNNTLLTYETGWQVRFFEPMVQSQLAGNYPMACNYGISLLIILRVPNNEMPKKQQPLGKSSSADFGTWLEYYNTIMFMIASRISDTIVDVRAKYQRRGDIPSYEQPRDDKK